MAFKTGVEDKPWWVGALVGLLVGIGIALLLYQWLGKPKVEELARLETKHQELLAKIQEGRAAKAQLPRFREEVRRLELELDKLLRILPGRRNTPELMRRIRALAEEGDLNLRWFKPSGEVDREFYTEWPISISLDGTYHNLALLFDRISRFSRIINIEGLKIEASRGEGRYTIAANFIAKTFIYKETPPEPAGATTP